MTLEQKREIELNRLNQLIKDVWNDVEFLKNTMVFDYLRAFLMGFNYGNEEIVEKEIKFLIDILCIKYYGFYIE